MSKSRPAVGDYATYVAVRFVVCVVQMLSPNGAAGLARALAWLAYRVDRRHRLVADDNLRHAYPDLDAGRRDRMVRDVYRHFCGLLTDIILLPRKLNPYTWRRHLDLAGGRELVGALLSGRPVLFVTGHFGNWEMGGYALGLLGFKTAAIARRLDNPHLHRFLARFRQGTGQEILDKSRDYARIEATLAGRGVLATVADQDAGAKGLFVDFFGRPASTHKAVALLAREYDATMVVTGVAKVGHPLRYRCVVGDVIRPADYADRPDAVRAMTERFTVALERLVRGHPEQYFWLHRRWKHQPAPKKVRRAA